MIVSTRRVAEQHYQGPVVAGSVEDDPLGHVANRALSAPTAYENESSAGTIRFRSLLP